MIYVIILLLVFFTSCSVLIAYHLNKIFSVPEINFPSGFRGKYSIVIAARNEEKNIPALIGSLQNIKYPTSDFEVIIADDNSSDNTYKTAADLSAHFPNYKVIRAVKKVSPGKKGVLEYGISAAENEFIMITDADCLPEEDWLRKYSVKFSEGFDFLFGIAPYFSERTLTGRLSAFENMRSFMLGFAALSMKIPYTASARNMGFRKCSFMSVNGYSNTRETLSGDDDLLLREAVKNKMKIGVVPFEGSKVFTRSKTDLNEYIKQRARHTKTSFYYHPVHKILLSFWHLINLLFLISPLLIFYNPFFVILFAFKLTADAALVLTYQKKFGYKFNSAEIIFQQVIYEFFIVINFIASLLRKDKW